VKSPAGASRPEGRAVVYCEGAFGTTNGKTAHGLVRRTRRYSIESVIDSRHAAGDAGRVLDGKERGIPVLAGLQEAIERAGASGRPLTHFVVGLAPDGGRLDATHRRTVAAALRAGLNVDSGLHDFLSEDRELVELAAGSGARIRDVRMPPPRERLHFFSGKIDEVEALKIAVLGTDSAVGKRTTAWMIVDALAAEGLSTELIGTGQTAWMQGVRYGVILDSVVNDFVTGEIEHAVWSCWNDVRPEVIVLEGQGSLLNPAYPGGFELIAAGRPDLVVLQHAPARTHYDGFPAYPLHPLETQIEAVELISGRPVVAICVNHESMDPQSTRSACARIRRSTARPAVDVLLDGVEPLLETLRPRLPA